MRIVLNERLSQSTGTEVTVEIAARKSVAERLLRNGGALEIGSTQEKSEIDHFLTMVTHEIMVAARQLHLHEDLADRILAATARLLDLRLATADERLLHVDGVPSGNCWWEREELDFLC